MNRPPSGPRANPSPESRLGSLVQGEYLIDKLVGDDILGPIYEAENARRKGRFRLVMLRKEISPPLKTMLAVRNDLRRAAEPGAGLVPIEQVADASGVAGFATEILPGETLADHLQKGPMPLDRALVLLGALTQSLGGAHAKGLLHGDLRPENVLLVHPEVRKPYGGRAMLLGHTLHRLLPRPSVRSPLDRLIYRAPEQIDQTDQTVRGVAPDERGEVFALGALLYECLVGTPAFEANDGEAVLQRLQKGPPLLSPAPERGLTAEVAKTLDVVIAGACIADPRTRMPDMASFARALKQVARGAGMEWPEQGIPRREVSIVRFVGALFEGGLPRRRAESGGRTMSGAAGPVVASSQSSARQPVARPAKPAPGPSPHQTQPDAGGRSDEAPYDDGDDPPTIQEMAVPDLGPQSVVRLAKEMSLQMSKPIKPAAAPAQDADPGPAPAPGESAESKPPSATRPATSGSPPPLPKSALGRQRGDEKTKLLRNDAWQRETTLPVTGSHNLRNVRASDITQLVAQVQQGELDPQVALDQVQQGQPLGQLARLLDLLLLHPRLALGGGLALIFFLVLLTRLF